MVMLRLTANNDAEKRIREYLQANASEALIEKINNGIKITQDGKELISKKDLTGFMIYATEEARKLVEKNAKSACVEDAVVYGWAIHYFEEDSIQGTLYNLDGTPYKKVIPKTNSTSVTTKKVVSKPEPADKQLSIFDFDNLPDNSDKQEETDEPEDDVEEDDVEEDVVEEDDVIDEPEDDDEQDDTELEELEIAKQQVQEVVDNYAKATPDYKKYCELKQQFMDYIVLYRLGDFYEMYNDDAVAASNLLDLTLVSKKVGLQERIPLAGLPYHALEPYLRKLSTKHKVLVYSEYGDKYVIENGQKIDIVTGDTAPAFSSSQENKQQTPPVETNPHVQYLQTIVNDLRTDR